MKIKSLVIIIAIVVAAISAIAIALPAILVAAGINPTYTGTKYSMPGGRALIITTSHDVLGDTGKPTGVYASEMTVPYYHFLDGGLEVDVASIEGGKIPIEAVSLRWPLLTAEDKRFLKDTDLLGKVDASKLIDDIDFTEYDVIFLAGGWGAAYDLGFSEVLGKKLTEANASGVVFGSVCHGALGFLKAKDVNGRRLGEGRRMTAVTDKQVRELRITMTPQHPERELRAAGALYESAGAFRDMLASHVVVDGNMVTGQNQNDGARTAQLLIELALKKGLKQSE